jgi:hypothetical protein
MAGSYVHPAERWEPVGPERYEVHWAARIEKTELQIPVTPARLRPDVGGIGLAEITADHDEVGTGSGRRVLTDAMPGVEVHFRQIAAAAWIVVGTIAEV